MTDVPTILLDVRLEALPGARDAMIALLRHTMAISQAERGCLIYRFGIELDDDHRFTLTELWETEADLYAHATGPAFHAFRDALPGCGRVLSSVARSGVLASYAFRRPTLEDTGG